MADKQGVYAVITGASGGIGREFAELFAIDGINLVLAARGGAALTEVAKRLKKKHKIEVYVSAGDLSLPGIAEGLFKFTRDHDLNVEYLVNNAGFGSYGDFIDSDWKTEKDMIDLNITTLTYLSKVFGKRMKERGSGHIVNVASMASLNPGGPMMAVYYATKAYVLSFSQALSSELVGSNVWVTALCPGPTATGFAERAKMSGNRMFSGRLPKAHTVAVYGYNAMLRQETIAIPGLGNRAAAVALKLLPRKTILRAVSRSQRRSLSS